MKPLHRLTPNHRIAMLTLAGVSVWACAPAPGETADSNPAGGDSSVSPGGAKDSSGGSASGGKATGGTEPSGGSTSAGANSGGQSSGGAASGGSSAEGGSPMGGEGNGGAPGVPRRLRAGAAHTCAEVSPGLYKCWGGNPFGQLGLGDTDNRGDKPGEMGPFLPPLSLASDQVLTDLAPGNGHSCAVLQGGGVKCWGINNRTQLGLGDDNDRGDEPGEMGDLLPQVPLGTNRHAKVVAAGVYHSCAIFDDGAVKCWGMFLGLGTDVPHGDSAEEMGDSLPTIELGTGRTAKALGIGAYHTCALLDGGLVKCWGANDYGQLGLGDLRPRGDEPDEMGDALPTVDLGTGRTAVSLTVGFFHACALLDDGSMKCWGRNDYGQLGLGDTNHRGDEPGEMGDLLPSVDLGARPTAQSVSGGALHTCALLDDGSVTCWGNNDHGQLGTGNSNHSGDGPSEMGDSLQPVSLGTRRRAITLTTGGAHACVQLDDDSIKCWGANDHGQLGLGDTNDRGDEPGEMGDALPAVSLW